MAYKIKFSHTARSDINDIVLYISTDDHTQAVRFARLLIQRALSLGQFPGRGRVVPEFGDEHLREIIVRAYRTGYRVDHQNRLVEIIRFWHPGRAGPHLLQ